MENLFDTPDSVLQNWLAEQRQPPFRQKQIRQAALQPGIVDFEQMSNLPKALRQRLGETFRLRSMRPVAQTGSPQSSAEKFLLELADGNRIETVVLHNDRGEPTLCVSTQVGCAMRCAFCASGMNGVVRNLTSGEILEQFLFAADHLKATADAPLSHAVIMGMGEPTANLDALLAALEIVVAPEGLGLGARKITLSTVGTPTGIDRLAQCGRPYHLAISLHAPNDELRSQLIPANRVFPIQPLLEAADRYFNATGRRVTCEYILLAGLNDRDEHATQLARLLKHRCALVNLIPYNPVKELPFQTPSAKQVRRFAEILEKAGIPVVTRHRKGDAIDAACGQLRASHKNP
ncbi:MAG: 23S rRNA (adenine(2503)-C(2))-methyltransferase RlmN [Planctomycetia bacterium]|nr:23S rRNA (adenine(2503)-C(2))-methyltransferase RlmN [Planctomycetia bacterium]